MIIRRLRPERRWRGYSPNLNAMREEFNRLLDKIDEAEAPVSAGVYPPMNIWQDDQAFSIVAELPGVNAKDIELSILKQTITLSGSRKIREEGEEVSYHRKERQEGKFKRSIELPAKVDTENINAQFTDGVLTIRVPKSEDERPRQISVRAV